MREHFEGMRCPKCGHPSGHYAMCRENKASKKENIKEDPINWNKDVEEKKMDFDEAVNDAWDVRREAVKIKARMEMGDEGDERGREVLENMIHSGKAEQPPKEIYDAGNMIVKVNKTEEIRNKELEKVREKLESIK